MCDGGEAMTNSQKKDEEKKSVAPIVTAAVIGAVIGAAIGFVVTTGTSGDEAPIKVKNGSLHIELLHSKQKFKDKNSGNPKKEFEINSNGGAHGSDEFEVFFAASGSQTGCAVRHAVGKTVEVVTNSPNANNVKITAPGNKTQIVAEKDLELDQQAERILTYGTLGTNQVYVSAIYVRDGSGTAIATCTLSGYDPELHVVLLDK